MPDAALVKAEAVYSACTPTASDRRAPQNKRAHNGNSVTAFFVGSLLLGGFGFLVGSCPHLLALAYLGFAATCLPYRVYNFWQRSWHMYLLDFCYVINGFAVLYLLLLPTNTDIGATVYVLCEGPLATALLPWQCAWVLTSWDHTLSVLVHLLPGLALFAHRHIGGPMGLATPTAQLQYIVNNLGLVNATRGMGASAGTMQQQQHLLTCTGHGEESSTLYTSAQPLQLPQAGWTPLLLHPLLVYVSWQVLYWLVVQVLMERRVRERKWDSSFKCLMRRVRRSSGAPLWLRQAAGASTPAAARVAVFGVLQLGFTLGTLPLGIASYRWWQVGAGWQVIKLVATLYFGAQYTCTRMLGKEHED